MDRRSLGTCFLLAFVAQQANNESLDYSRDDRFKERQIAALKALLHPKTNALFSRE